jgi:hypothetical protein
VRNLLALVLLALSLIALSACPKGAGGEDTSGGTASAGGGTGAGTVSSTGAAAQPDAGGGANADNQTILGAGDSIDAKCAVCGMDASLSYAEVKHGNMRFCGIGHWVQFATENKIDHADAQMLDYETRDGERKYVDLKTAFFVEAKSLRMTMPPFFAAFASEDAAKAFATEQGAEALPFEAVMTKAMEAGGDAEKKPVPPEDHSK